MQEHGPPSAYPTLPPPPAAVPPVDRTPLRELAIRQRWAMIAGVANGVGGALVYGRTIPDGLAAVVAIGVGVFVIVAAVRLANHLYGVGPGILSGVAMLVPLVWIAVLVFLCTKASKQLRQAGVRVGFFGAAPDTI